MFSVFGLLIVCGQTVGAFNDVSVISGKVVFQQFIPNSDGVSNSQQYLLLQQWGKEKSQKNPLLSGIRFNDKKYSVTVSAGEEFQVVNSTVDNVSITMRYRFDVSVTSAGYMLVIRDIIYQIKSQESASVFPETYAAEQMITNEAINAMGGDRVLKDNTRKATLDCLNKLFEELSSL